MQKQRDIKIKSSKEIIVVLELNSTVWIYRY